jgi:hypothetical protein
VAPPWHSMNRAEFEQACLIATQIRLGTNRDQPQPVAVVRVARGGVGSSHAGASGRGSGGTGGSGTGVGAGSSRTMHDPTTGRRRRRRVLPRPPVSTMGGSSAHRGRSSSGDGVGSAGRLHGGTSYHPRLPGTLDTGSTADRLDEIAAAVRANHLLQLDIHRAIRQEVAAAMARERDVTGNTWSPRGMSAYKHAHRPRVTPPAFPRRQAPLAVDDGPLATAPDSGGRASPFLPATSSAFEGAPATFAGVAPVSFSAPTADGLAAGREGEEDEGRGRCVICLDSSVDTVVYRCGHLCMCHACATQVGANNQLPTWRQHSCSNLSSLPTPPSA